MNIREYVSTLRRRWPLILGCLVGAAAIAAAVSSQITPQYASSARLYVSTPQTAGAEVYQGALASQQRVKSYADLITGQTIAERVVQQLNLDTSPGQLVRHISADVAADTVILTVTVTQPDPQQAQRITQAVASTFSDYVAELETPPGEKTAPMKAIIVDRADLPASPISPKPVRNIVLAAGVGLLVGLGMAVLRDTLDVSITSKEDVEQITQSPLLATVPFDKQAGKRPLISGSTSDTPRAEAFRILRTNLQYIDVDRPASIITVTSCVPLEGKTTTTVNLALSLAQAGRRVALVEGDLRRPRLAEYLRLEPTVGTTTVLIGAISLDQALQPFDAAGPDVLASGPIPPNPAELLQSRALHELLAQLRERYDTVLVDAPPLLPVTDAALIAAQTDGALLVVRHGKTTRDQISHAVDRLHHVGAHLLGAILNMTPNRSAGSYGHHYSYGYGNERPRTARHDMPPAAEPTTAGPPTTDLTASGQPRVGEEN